MSDILDMASVVFREGRPSKNDYAEAIESLTAASTQICPDGRACVVCGDDGHQAFECHHNPLVMSRRAVELGNAWRCFHCGARFTRWDAAQEHFGKTEDEKAKCLNACPCGREFLESEDRRYHMVECGGRTTWRERTVRTELD